MPIFGQTGGGTINKVTDGTNSVLNAGTVLFTGPTVSGASPEATVTAGGVLNFSDSHGHSVNGASSLNFSGGGTVSGTPGVSATFTPDWNGGKISALSTAFTINAGTLSLTASGGTFSDLTDGTNSVANVATLTINGGTVSGTGGNGTITVSGSGGGGIGTISAENGVTSSATTVAMVNGVIINRPSSSAFTSLNTGTLTDHANGPLSVTCTTGTSDKYIGAIMAAPGTTPWTLTACVGLDMDNYQWLNGGIFVSDGTKIVAVQYDYAGGDQQSDQQQYNLYEWNSPSSAAQAPLTGTTKFTTQGAEKFWLQIINDGTHLTFQQSSDGFDFVNINSQTVTNFLSNAGSIGVGGNTRNLSANPHEFLMKVYSWVTH